MGARIDKQTQTHKPEHQSSIMVEQGGQCYPCQGGSCLPVLYT